MPYLRCLIAVEEASFRSAAKGQDFFARHLRHQRRKIGNAAEETWLASTSSPAKASLQEHVTDVCVAAGDPRIGASAEEIRAKTRLSPMQLKKCLALVVDCGLLRLNPVSGLCHNVPPATNA